MTARVLRLPQTPEARKFLALCVRLAGGWEFPDGSNAADFDWDRAYAYAYSEESKMCSEGGGHGA